MILIKKRNVNKTNKVILVSKFEIKFRSCNRKDKFF